MRVSKNLKFFFCVTTLELHPLVHLLTRFVVDSRVGLDLDQRHPLLRVHADQELFPSLFLAVARRYEILGSLVELDGSSRK